MVANLVERVVDDHIERRARRKNFRRIRRRQLPRSCISVVVQVDAVIGALNVDGESNVTQVARVLVDHTDVAAERIAEKDLAEKVESQYERVAKKNVNMKSTCRNKGT